jgi:hypothetical protein
MAIQSRKNQYVGVNAHLMSLLQAGATEAMPPSWRGFHNHFIARLMEALNAHLPHGYVAVNDESLQVLGEDREGMIVRKKPIPDISVYQQGESQTKPGVQVVGTPTWQAVIEKQLEPDNTIDAVVIYQQGAGHRFWGKAVARIELLSPTNKRGGSNYVDYSRKRREAFLTGVPLIEIDLLHETRSPISELPVYPRQGNAYPYTLAINDPRHDPEQIKIEVYGFNVDRPFPTIPLPLIGADFLAFNCDEAYQQSYILGPWNRIVDYEQLPERFDTYSEADQTRIQARLAAVMNAHQQGLDLEQGPFPVEDR